MSGQVILFGAGGHAKVMLEALEASRPGIEILIIDDNPEAAGRIILGRRVRGTRGWLAENSPGAAVAAAIGNNAARAELIGWLQAQGRRVETVVAPSAVASPSATLGTGSFLAPGAHVNAETILEPGVIVNTCASIDHDCRIGFAAHVAPGAHLCGGVTVGARTLIGAGATIIPGMTVGADAVIAAGAVVTAPVPDGARVGGVPARPLPARPRC
jgi:sugar O-acyltransferase (sialic acid O-acetyltransferase NeuD family)